MVGEAIGVKVSFGPEYASGQLAQIDLSAPTGIVDDRIQVQVELLPADSANQFEQPALAGHVGRDLSSKIAGRFSLAANLREYQPENVVHYSAGRHEFDRRNDDAFLEDFSKYSDAGRRAPAHVHVVGEVGQVTNRLDSLKHRRNHSHVVQMNPAVIGVIGNQHIARLKLLLAV